MCWRFVDVGIHNCNLQQGGYAIASIRQRRSLVEGAQEILPILNGLTDDVPVGTWQILCQVGYCS